MAARSMRKTSKGSKKGNKNSSLIPSSSSSRTKMSSTIIEEDEFITDITGSRDFNVNTYWVNPGQSTTFPWLSGFCDRYEKYKFHSLEFYYKPTVSAYAGGGQTGKVIMSFDTDASDPAPASKRQMEATVPHSDGMPYQTVRLPIHRNIIYGSVPSLGHYIRTGGLPPGTDVKTYDVGTLSLATVGQPLDPGPVGELRVKYKVELLIPVLESVETIPPTFSVYSSGTIIDDVYSSKIAGGDVYTDASLYAKVSLGPAIYDSLNVRLEDGDTEFKLQPGNYFCSYSMNVITGGLPETNLGYTYTCLVVGSSPVNQSVASFSPIVSLETDPETFTFLETIQLNKGFCLKVSETSICYFGIFTYPGGAGEVPNDCTIKQGASFSIWMLS